MTHDRAKAARERIISEGNRIKRNKRSVIAFQMDSGREDGCSLWSNPTFDIPVLNRIFPI